jgi:MFS family permease
MARALVLVSRLKLLGPLRARDFRRLWAGMVASLIGDGVFTVAIAWQAYSLWNAPTALAAVGFATSLPQIILLLAGGIVADRFDRRAVIVVVDVIRGLVIASLGGLSLAGALTMAWLVVLVGVYGAATAFFGPAFDALVPQLAPPEQLTEANALDQFARPAAQRLAGPALGGLLVAVAGAGSAFVLDGLSFVISAACVAGITPRPAVRGGPADRLSLEEVRLGLRFVRARVWLWGTFLGATLSYLLFTGPSEVLLPFVVKNNLHSGAGALGLVFAAGGVGALFAAAIAGQRGMPARHITWMYVCWSLATLAVAGYGLAVSSWQLAAACFVFNGLEAAGTVWWATLKGLLVPGPLLGRVSSFDWFISTALVPLSYALTAPVATAIGARATLVTVGVVGAVTTLAPLFLRGMREVERSGTARPGSEALARVE